VHSLRRTHRYRTLRSRAQGDTLAVCSRRTHPRCHVPVCSRSSEFRSVERLHSHFVLGMATREVAFPLVGAVLNFTAIIARPPCSASASALDVCAWGRQSRTPRSRRHRAKRSRTRRLHRRSRSPFALSVPRSPTCRAMRSRTRRLHPPFALGVCVWRGHSRRHLPVSSHNGELRSP
jgi:hypothetical protein